MAIGLDGALRLWIEPPAAFRGAFLFLTGAPTAPAVTELMVMHYLESIALVTLALTFHVLAQRSQRKALDVFSAVLYLSAMLAKEIAVPLFAFLLLLDNGGLTQRIRRTVAHWVALAVYVVWRRLMLGELFGGYGWTVTRAEVPALLLSLSAKLARMMTGPNLFAGVLLLMAITAAVALGLPCSRAVLLVISGLILATLPIVPVSKEMQPRFVLGTWIALVALAAISASRTGGRTATVSLCTLAVLGLIVQRTTWPDKLRRARRMSDDGRFFFFEKQPGSLLRIPVGPPAAMGELQWLKESYAKRPAGANWFYDDWYACTHGLSSSTVWQYSDGLHRYQTRSSADRPRLPRSSQGAACRGVPSSRRRPVLAPRSLSRRALPVPPRRRCAGLRSAARGWLPLR